MELSPDFAFRPLPAIENETLQPFPQVASPFGPLAPLVGTWTGRGFNTIWRPNHTPADQDRFLELNLTSDQIEFSEIPGPIPNRGLLQPDINMFGLRYLNQISDANVGAGLHLEPGIWAVVPATTDPKVVPTVVRMASIPHGTVALLQGTAVTTSGGPNIAVKGIKPFGIGGPPTQTIDFPEQTLANHTNFRTSGAGLTGITQQMVNNPNSVLTAAIAGQHITSTTTLHVTTIDLPTPGGGTANTAFLKGGADGPNATAVSVTATFWLETLQGQSAPTQLQYTQTVLLNFNGISWPHVTVGTLQKS
jgi:hypothetical protein